MKKLPGLFFLIYAVVMFFSFVVVMGSLAFSTVVPVWLANLATQTLSAQVCAICMMFASFLLRLIFHAKGEATLGQLISVLFFWACAAIFGYFFLGLFVSLGILAGEVATFLFFVLIGPGIIFLAFVPIEMMFQIQD